MLLFIVTTPLRVSQQIINEHIIDHEYAAEAYDDSDDYNDNDDNVRYDDGDDNDDLYR